MPNSRTPSPNRVPVTRNIKRQLINETRKRRRSSSRSPAPSRSRTNSRSRTPVPYRSSSNSRSRSRSNYSSSSVYSRSRSRTPQKKQRHPKTYYIEEGENVRERKRYFLIHARRGDIVKYMPNNQEGQWEARLMKDNYGKKYWNEIYL